jgi:hypothetical protein
MCSRATRISPARINGEEEEEEEVDSVPWLLIPTLMRSLTTPFKIWIPNSLRCVCLCASECVFTCALFQNPKILRTLFYVKILKRKIIIKQSGFREDPANQGSHQPASLISPNALLTLMNLSICYYQVVITLILLQ